MRDSKSARTRYPLREESDKVGTERRKDEKKLLPTILGVIIMLVLLIVILYAVVLPKEEGTIDFSATIDVHATTDTTTSAEISIGHPTDPVNFMIMLQCDSASGVYVFPSNEDGVELTLDSGYDLGTIVYLDRADNGLVDSKDRVLVSDLNPGTEYRIRLLWKDGYELDSDRFSTRAG